MSKANNQKLKCAFCIKLVENFKSYWSRIIIHLRYNMFSEMEFADEIVLLGKISNILPTR